MYYFIDKNYTVCRKEHKFNSEYLDGNLTLCEQTDTCFVVLHTPSDSFGYDVKRIAIITVATGYQKIQTLNNTLADSNPPTYYSLILVSQFWAYIQKTDYTDKTDNVTILTQDQSSDFRILPKTVTVVEDDPTTPNIIETVTKIVEPSVDYIPTDPLEAVPTVVRTSNSDIIDALNEGIIPNIKQLGEAPLYKYTQPNLKNT
jgi:hypothetical protein